MQNIFNLMWKDILVLKRHLWFAAIYGFVALFAFSTFQSGALSAALIGVTYTLITQACAHDDKNHSEIMIISLPILRREIVLAKYLSTFLYAAFGFVSYFLAQIVVTFLGLPIYVQRVTLGGFIVALFALVVLVSIYFPIYFKFGYLRSRMVGMFLFFACFFIIPFSINLSSYFLKKRHNAPIQTISLALKRVGEWLTTQTNWQISCYMFALVLIMLVSSTGISLKFYANREF